MRTVRFALLLVASFLTFNILHGVEVEGTFRVAVLNASRNGDANISSGILMADLRRALELPAHAGSFFKHFTLVPYGEFTPGSLTGASKPDLVILHNAFDLWTAMPQVLSGSEQDELYRYVEEGGALFIAVDAYAEGATPAAVDAANAILAPFDIRFAQPDVGPICRSFTPVDDPMSHPVTNGPFGLVERILLDRAGWLVDLGPYASPLVSHPTTGEPAVAVIERGAIAAGSGRVLVVSDINWMADDDYNSNLYFPKHEVFFLNAVAWLTRLCGPKFVATRTISPADLGVAGGFRPGDSIRVTIRLAPYDGDADCTPDRDDSETGLELWEFIPAGWTVDPESVSDGGVYADCSAGGCISWLDLQTREEPFAVSYVVHAGSGQEDAEFLGEVRQLSTTSVEPAVRGDHTVHPRADTVLRIATLDETRNDSWNFFDSLLFRDMRQTLATRAGELGFDRIDLLPLRELTDETLADAHLVFLNSRAEDLSRCPDAFEFSSKEQDALRDFVRAGGGALILLESGQYPGSQLLLDPFEVQLENATWQDTNTNPIADPDAHPITSGPFGTVGYVKSDFSGWFSDLGPYASPLVDLAPVGQPFLATIERNVLDAGSGPVLLSADVNWLADLPVGSDEDRYFFFRESPHEDLFLNALAWLTERASGPEFLRGDCNNDSEVNITDAVCILTWLFAADGDPHCIAATNTNGDKAANISDATYLLNFLFGGGEAPVGPFPDCGASGLEADSALGCVTGCQ